MDRKKIVLICSILLLAILGIFLVFSFNGKKLETAQFDSIKMSYYNNSEIVLDEKNTSIDYYFEVSSDKDDSSYNISLVTENKTNASDEKIKVSLLKNGEYIVGSKDTGEAISSDKLSELLSNQLANKNSKDVYVLKIWSEEEVKDGNLKVSVKVEEVKKIDDKIVRIKLDADGGILSVAEVSIDKNGSYGALPIPVKDGYNFIGWYSKKENGKLIAKETKYSSVKADILYALYDEKVVVKPNIDVSNKVELPKTESSNDNTTLPPAVVVAKKEYTITFITNGGSEIKPITLLEGTKIENVDNPIREGYDFVGWDLALPEVMPSNNLVLNALWKAKTYNVNLKFSEKLNVKKSVVYDSAYGTLPDVSKDGYTFIGWFTSEVDGEQVKGEDIVKITSDITLYARLEANKYNIKFSSDTSDVIEDIEVTYDQMYGELPVVSKNGYSFDGWYLDRDYKEKVNSTDIVKITSDVILFARFVANRYTITFDFGYDMLNKDIYYGEQYGDLPVASKDGYDFVGWFTAGADGVQITSDSVYEFATNQILYARYEAKKLNVSFETFGGSIHEKIQVTYDDIYGELPTPEKTGYTFGGWFFDNEFKNIVSGLDTVKVLEDITLYAKFTANTYTLTMDFNFDVGATMNKDITYDQAYGELVQPDRYGYTFMGWYTAQSGGELITKDTIVKVTSNLTIYARWNQSGVLKLTGNTKQSRLPLEYQELEYIESTGTQYIDTGVLASEKNSFKTEAQLVHVDNGSQTLYGGRNSDSSGSFQGNQISFIGSVPIFQFIYGDYHTSGSQYTYEKHVYYSKKNLFYIDDNLIFTLPESDGVTQTNNVYLFATNTAGSIGFHGGDLKMYYFKIWSDDELVRDFVPAYRKSDAEVGLYDLVNGKFYTNDGTGTFKSGKRINEFVQNSTIPSSITSVGDRTKNLFNLNNANIRHAYVNETRNQIGYPADDSTLILIPCKSNSSYTISYDYGIISNSIFRTGYISVADVTSTTWTDIFAYDNSLGKSHVVTTGDDATFIFIQIGTKAYEVIKNSLMVQEGTAATEYEPYGYKIPIDVTGKNIADPQYIYDYVDRWHSIYSGDATNVVDSETGRKVFRLFAGSGWYNNGPVDEYDNYKRIFTGIFKEKTQYTISFSFYHSHSTNCLNLGVKYTDGTYQSLEESFKFVPNEEYNYSFTSQAGKTIDYIYLEYRTGTTYIYMDTLQIEEGAKATSYEPFVRKDVIKQSKNLFDESKYDQVSEYKTKGNNTYTYAEILLKPNTTYRVSIKRYNGHTGNKYGYLLLSDHSGINGHTWTAIEHLTSPNNSNVNYIYTTGDSGKLYIGYNEGYGFTDAILSDIWKNTDVQIEEGTQATEYEPYYRYENVMYLDEPLRCVGGICDYIDFESGEVIRKVRSITFNGHEEWKTMASDIDYFYLIIGDMGYVENNVGVSSHYTRVTVKESNVNVGFNVVNSSHGNARIICRPYDYEISLEEWLKYLKKQYNNGTPLEVYYVLADSVTEEVLVPEIPFGNGNVVNFGTKVKPSIE